MQARTGTMGARGTIRGQNCVITGANRGIGLELARQLLQRGNDVYAAVRTPTSELDALAAQNPERLHVASLDVSSPASIEGWAKQLAGGCEHVDLLINNAGTYGRSGVTVDNVTEEDMQDVFQVNTIGPLLVVQQLRRQGLLGGHTPSLIGNMTSKVGSVDDNSSGGGYAYRASKSALNIINKSMSIDLKKDNITSVLLHPGYVRTRMVNFNGLIDADKSAAGLLSVLEGDLPLNGHWYDWKSEEIPW